MLLHIILEQKKQVTLKKCIYFYESALREKEKKESSPEIAANNFSYARNTCWTTNKHNFVNVGSSNIRVF